MESRRSFSVRPIFELVSKMHRRMEFIHRFIATRNEFEHYLKTWSQARYSKYPILYLSLHGSENCLHIGDGKRNDSEVSLDEIAALVSGRCKGRIIHFGSCGTMGVDRRHLTRFLRTTGATGISGYIKNVGMLEPAAFEVLMLDQMNGHALNGVGIKAIQRRLSALVPSLQRELGFRFVAL